MIRWGINALNHGSSLAVFDDDRLVFNKFDRKDELDKITIDTALKYGSPDHIYWYENPWLKKIRQLRAGQWSRAFDLSVLPKNYLERIGIDKKIPITYTQHHASHAAAGYYTSPFNHCAIVVLDAIGEFECASIWIGKHGDLKKVWSRSYPHSLGLFYSAFTDLLGFTPVQDEYRLQELSKKGNPHIYFNEVNNYFNGLVSLTENLHQGVKYWPYEIKSKDRADIAAAVQAVFEQQVGLVMTAARSLTESRNLIYMGGCAMNSLANKNQVEPKFKYIWSLPQPGDPSSSIGAVLYQTKQRLWNADLGVAKHIRICV